MASAGAASIVNLSLGWELVGGGGIINNLFLHAPPLCVQMMEQALRKYMPKVRA